MRHDDDNNDADEAVQGEPDSETEGWRARWRRRGWRQQALIVASGATLLAAVAAIQPVRWWYSCGSKECPTVAELRTWTPSEGGRVLDREGSLLAPLTPTRRENVALEEVPKHVRDAFIAVEDRRFYEHEGVDWRGVVRALVANVKEFGVSEGASTISMQLARNVFLSDRATERSLQRKLLEWRYAVLLEEALTKEEILERYLNAIYLGGGVYGVEGASRDLFGKGVEDVTIAEAALLAGLPKAPSVYSPRRDIERARERRDIALAVMLREGKIDDATYAKALKSEVRRPKAEWRPDRPTASWASEYARVVVDSLREANEIDPDLHEGQLIVFTTVDTKAQRAAEAAVNAGAAQVDRQRGSSASRARTQGALVAIDPESGAILALVGGRGSQVTGFDRATRAKRQPGSAFKPFVYAAAMQQGFTTATMVEDVPISIPDNGGTWTPANYDHHYLGRVTMRDALKRSANAATVRVSRDVGMHNVISVARAMGIESDLPQVPSLALGAGAVTPIELTAAYAAFSNGGMRVTPHIVLRIDDIFGRTIWTAPPPQRTQALSPADAFLVTSMLRSVVDEGTGNGVRSGGVRGPVAGKTGTTNDGADVWFVGFTPSIVASVWFGTDRPQPLGGGASGGRVAAPVWANFIRKGWHSPAEDTEWVPPAGIVERWVDVATGMRADPWCGASRKEFFKMGSEPIASCTESMIYAFEPLISGWSAGVLDDTTKIDTIIDTLIARSSAAASKMTEAVRALFGKRH